jgi:hypothetical protein
VNVSFDDCRIHPQLASPHDLLFLGYGNQSLMYLLHHFRAQRLHQPPKGLGVGDFFRSNPCKLSVHHIGPYFPLGFLKAPVPHMLQHR